MRYRHTARLVKLVLVAVLLVLSVKSREGSPRAADPRVAERATTPTDRG